MTSLTAISGYCGFRWPLELVELLLLVIISRLFSSISRDLLSNSSSRISAGLISNHASKKVV